MKCHFMTYSSVVFIMFHHSDWRVITVHNFYSSEAWRLKRVARLFVTRTFHSPSWVYEAQILAKSCLICKQYQTLAKASTMCVGVTLDSELTMQRHVNKVASACFYHIRRLKQIRRLIGPKVTATLMSAFVLSKLDYCNAILAGLPKSTIAPLQRAQNAAARLIGLVAPRDHVTSMLQQLHWLPVQYRITYKLCLLMHLIHTSQAPSYLTDIVTQTASVTSRTRLRSGSSLRYEQPRTRLKFGQRAFSYAAPAVWNSLPPSLQELLVSDTASFKRNLKTSLFQQAFYRWVVFTFCTLPLGFILVFRCAVHHWSLL